MKFGFRTPSLKKSVSARTTGRIKRSVKKAVNPTYGKKGMGWVNDPNKAAYNKVYNKTTVGVQDMVKSGNMSSNHSRATSGASYTAMMQREIDIVNDCARVMKTTVNPDVYFSRYELYMEKLTNIADAERHNRIHLERGSESPAEKLKEMQNSVAENFNEFINRYWKSVNQKAKTMKTEKGKENQYRRFYDKLMEQKSSLPQECIENINSKIKRAGINIEK